MSNDKNIKSSVISPPGDTLKEHLDFIGMKPADLAKKMKLSRKKIDDLISGKDSITAEIASSLENVLGIPAAFWRNREKEYRREVGDCGVGG